MDVMDEKLDTWKVIAPVALVMLVIWVGGATLGESAWSFQYMAFSGFYCLAVAWSCLALYSFQVLRMELRKAEQSIANWTDGADRLTDLLDGRLVEVDERREALELSSVAYATDREVALKSVSPLSVTGARHLPTIFTGLGIVFTFFGLIQGLLGSEFAAISGGEASVDSIGLQNLLSGVGLAFRSSLVGVGGSIVCTIAFRLYDARLDKVANAVREAALRKDREEAPGEVLQQSYGKLDRLVELTSKQKAQIGKLGTDIKTAFENALADQLEEKVGSRLNALDDTLTSFAEAQAETQQQAMDEALETFREEFANNLGTQFEALEQTLDKHIEWQGRLQESLQRAVAQSEELIDRISEHEAKLSDITEKREELLSRQAEIEQQRITRFESTLTKLEETVSALETVDDELSSAHERWKGFLEQISEKTEDVGRAVDTMENVQSSLDESVSRTETVMAEAPDKLEESVDRMQHELEAGLRDTFEQFDEETARIADHLGGTHRRVESMLEEIDRVFGDIEQGLADQTETIRDVGERLQGIDARQLADEQSAPRAE
jgi:ABC-type transporter Mla subunit MlaD